MLLYFHLSVLFAHHLDCREIVLCCVAFWIHICLWCFVVVVIFRILLCSCFRQETIVISKWIIFSLIVNELLLQERLWLVVNNFIDNGYCIILVSQFLIDVDQRFSQHFHNIYAVELIAWKLVHACIISTVWADYIAFVFHLYKKLISLQDDYDSPHYVPTYSYNGFSSIGPRSK